VTILGGPAADGGESIMRRTDQGSRMSPIVQCTRCGAPVVEPGTLCVACRSPLSADRKKAEGSKATLLWIDDDRLLLGIGEEALARKGYRVLLASEGAAGIELARTERPDLILLDVVMFNTDGLDVCARLREEPGFAETPIVILTVLDDAAVRYRAKEVGATAVIHKPFALTDLVAMIEQILEAPPGGTTA
jgi:CheY-like chemotaxis protein